MSEFPIPVVALGPGSHSEEEALDYIAAPGEMATFAPPRLPETADAVARDTALAVLEELRARMAETPFAAGVRIDLAGLAPDVRALVNEALGQGEVSVTVAGSPGLRIQESVFAGVWRVIGEDGSDRIETGPMPSAVVAANRAAAEPRVAVPVPGDGVMNAPSVLRELLDVASRPRRAQGAHIVNLTLLPMTPADLDYLAGALGVGPVVILSRGYGNCRITATALRDTWWVQYFNSSDTLILNTLEVTPLPDVAPAAEEDYADSLARLGEWIAALRES